MANRERTIWDDLVEVGRKIVKEVDETLNPHKKRKPARVPVPVRNNPPRRPHDDPYNPNPY